MKIKLTGDLHPELRVLGLDTGDVITDPCIDSITGAAYFTIRGYVVPQNCVVYPENYEILNG